MSIQETLEEQLKTIYSKEAYDCLKIYAALKVLNDGSVRRVYLFHHPSMKSSLWKHRLPNLKMKPRVS